MGKVLKICHCTSNILQIQFKKETYPCHGIQDLLEGGETGDKASLESFIRYKGRLRLGKWLGKEYSEAKDSHQWW